MKTDLLPGKMPGKIYRLEKIRKIFSGRARNFRKIFLKNPDTQTPHKTKYSPTIQNPHKTPNSPT
jgi:hypothetical protein